MKREEFEMFGDKHKHYESLTDHQLMAGLPTVVRLDGRAFHTFTKNFKRPFDEQFHQAMVDTTRFLMDETHAILGYTQSDEISLVMSGELMFNGRLQKMCSTTAALASAYFRDQMVSINPKLPIATFDSRVFQYPNMSMAFECLVWREADAIRNSVSMLAQSLFSHKQLQNVGHKEKLKIAEEIGMPWDKLEVWKQRGSLLAKRYHRKGLDEAILAKMPEHLREVKRNETFIRAAYEVIDTLPSLGQMYEEIGSEAALEKIVAKRP